MRCRTQRYQSPKGQREDMPFGPRLSRRVLFASRWADNA